MIGTRVAAAQGTTPSGDAAAEQPPAERPSPCGGTIAGCAMRGGSQRVPVPVGPGQRRPPTAPRPPTRPTRSL
jgi:hypothetical protein